MFKSILQFLPRNALRNTQLRTTLRAERIKRLTAEGSVNRLENAIKELKKSEKTGEEPKDFSRVVAANMFARNKLEVMQLNIKSRYNIAFFSAIVGTAASVIYKLFLDEQAATIRTQKVVLENTEKKLAIRENEINDRWLLAKQYQELAGETKNNYLTILQKLEEEQDKNKALQKQVKEHKTAYIECMKSNTTTLPESKEYKNGNHNEIIYKEENSNRPR